MKMKRLLCLTLALLMLLTTAACGTQSETEATPEPTSDELVYAPEFRDLNLGFENGVTPLAFTADGIYLSSYEKTGEREKPEDAVVQYEGEYDIYNSVLYFMTYDGKTTKLEGYQPLPEPENTEGYSDYYSGSGLEKLLLLDDGFVTLESQYVSWYNGPESERNGDNQWQYREVRQFYFIRRFDANAKELSSAMIDDPLLTDGMEFYNAQLDKDGNICCVHNMDVVILSQEGKVLKTITTDAYPNGFLKLPDGRLALSAWGDVGLELNVIDLESGSLGEKLELPKNAYNILTGGGEYDFYYQNGTFLYGFNMGDTEGTQILNWINMDVNPDSLNGIQMREDGTILALSSDWSGEEVRIELVTLNLVPLSSLPKKETLTLAVQYLDYQLQRKIIDFNRRSDSTRIEVVDYAQYNTEEDYSAGLTKLTTEIMAGNIPDLLVLNQLPYDQLASKGLLEDLYPYLDADKELKREDFFPTVLAALEVNGGLYQVASSFQINTLIGASSVVGDKPGWTYEQFNAALASMPEGCTPLDQYTTRDDILQRLVTLEMDRLVDWQSGQCSFDGEDYVNILNFSNRFQAEFDWDSYEWSEDESTENRIAAGRQMLMTGSIYSLDDVLYNDLYFGGEATYIGYPVSEGTGSMMMIASGIGMSAKCAHKDEAWGFLRSLMTEEYQKNVSGLPINVNAFNAQLEKAMTPEYVKDAEGNFVLDEDGNRVQVSRGGIGMSDGTVKEFYAMSQEQADKLLEVINTTTRVMNQNSNLLEIITAEAQAFFAGQKSAEEVARLTQSKVNIYVNEHR